jgi:hypothetical protein
VSEQFALFGGSASEPRAALRGRVYLSGNRTRAHFQDSGPPLTALANSGSSRGSGVRFVRFSLRLRCAAIKGGDPVPAWLAEVVAKVEVFASSCGLLLFSELLRFKPAASHRRNDEAMIDNSLLVEPDRRWGNDFGFRFRRAYKGFEMAKMTKNQLIDAIAEGTEVSKQT